jgi:beta-lactam-binding protein with PASTA domain
MIFFKNFRYIFWVIPFGLFFSGYFFLRHFVHKKEFSTPNVIGKNVQEALDTLSSRGLNLRLVRQQENVNFPPGIILEQKPLQNRPICLNQHVFVVISKRPKVGKMPDFLSKKYKDVLPSLRNFNPSPTIVWLQSVFPFNFCMAQLPLEGSFLDDSEIVLYFSSGSCSKFVAPNLKGQNLSKVEEIMQKYNVSLDVLGKKVAGGDYIIIDQTPMPGSIVDLSKKLYIQILVKKA